MFAKNLFAAVGTFGVTLACPAAVVSIGQFSGGISESWESFPLYSQQPGTYLPQSTPIFGGNAVTQGNRFAVYRPGGGNGGWSLVTSGQANVADGTKGGGIDSPGNVGSLIFPTPITDFGGWWGAATGGVHGDPSTITVQFFDASSTLISTIAFPYSRSATGDGMLIWQGWQSSVPIGSVTILGPSVVMDRLQANLVPTPAGFSLIFAALSLGARRRRR